MRTAGHRLLPVFCLLICMRAMLSRKELTVEVLRPICWEAKRLMERKMEPWSRSDREEAREREYAARCRGTRGNGTLWIHAIWKYGNYTFVSLFSKCICNHSLDLTRAACCIFTEMNLQIQFFLSGRPWSKPLWEGASVLLDTETLSAGLSLTILCDFFSHGVGMTGTVCSQE